MAEFEDLAASLRRLHQQLSSLTLNPIQDRTQALSSEANAYLRHYALARLLDNEQIRYGLGALPCCGYHIACQYWLPRAPAATVFVVHGYFDHMGLYGHLFEYLLKHNFAVLAFDLPGHGLSDGERVAIASFDHYVEVFDTLLRHTGQHLPRPWHAVGQSTGGAIVLKHLLEEKSGASLFSRVALLAPLLHPRHWRGNRLVYFLAHRFIDSIQRHFTNNSGDPAFVEFLAHRDPLQATNIPMAWIGAMKRWTEEFHQLPASDSPLTIIQGNRDKTLDWRYNLNQFKKKLPRASIRIIPGAEHHLVNERETLRTDIFNSMGLANN